MYLKIIQKEKSTILCTMQVTIKLKRNKKLNKTNTDIHYSQCFMEPGKFLLLQFVHSDSLIGVFFFFFRIMGYVYSKKCWVKYNPALGKIWTNPAIGLFRPSGWVTAQKVGLKHLTQLLVENNPACVLSNIYPALWVLFNPAFFRVYFS